MAAAPARCVLITGASGFVGRALCASFVKAGWRVHATSRQPHADWPSGVQGFVVPDGSRPAGWRHALTDVDVVVHCAARVHVLKEQAQDPLAEFRKVNVDATLALADAVAESGSSRLVFLSTVGVHGAASGRRPIRSDDPPAPHSPYAQSKWEAELALTGWSRASGVELVCIRPPLVYGRDAPGNFNRLFRLVIRGTPLPLGAINNLRSMVSVENLASLVLRCADHPEAAGRAFLVSDDDDLSTTRLVREIARAAGIAPRLLPVPARLLQGTLRLLGRRAMADQLLGTLQIDIEDTRRALGWQPPLTVEQAMRACISHGAT